FDYREEGPQCYINVEEHAIPYTHLEDPDVNDYVLVKFAFIDPNGGNARLQDYTGGLNGLHLCEWQDNVLKNEKYYIINGNNLGEGVSYVYAVYVGYNNLTGDSVVLICDELIFL
ncbi:17220_t:CDS:2, partial [Gigaspora margarita]